MADPISLLASYVTAKVITALGTSSLLAAEVVYGAAYVAGTVAVSAGLNYASSLLGGGSPSPNGQTVAATGSVEPNRHMIGRTRVYGVQAWQGPFAWKSGDKKNSGFGQIAVISSTPITEIEEVLVADVLCEGVPETYSGVGAPRWLSAAMEPYDSDVSEGRSRLFYHVDIGSDPGIRSPLLGWFADQPWQPLVDSPYPDVIGQVPFYSPDARGDGLAKLSSAAYQDVNSFPAGPPRMSIVGKGLECFDPRDDDQGSQDPSTWKYSENPALLAAWYITRPFGFNAAYSEIDFDTLISAANACEEMVETFASTIVSGPVSDPPMEKRFRCGGEVIESENRDDVLNQIVASMAGSWCQSGGKWYLYAGVFTAPTEVIDNSWIMRNVQFTAQKSRLNLYNTVGGAFMSEARRWQTAPYPQVQDADALAADNGQEIIETIDLAFAPSSTQAQRIEIIELRRSHLPRGFQFETPIGFALRVVVGQTVSLNQLGLGYEIVDVPFRVTSWELAEQDDTGEIWVAIVLDEESAAIYNVGLDDMTDGDSLAPHDAPVNPESGESGDDDAPTGTIEGVFA